MEHIKLLLIFLISNFGHDLNVVPLLGHAPSDTPPPLSPLLPIGLGNFEPNVYLYRYPNNFVSVILPAYTTYEDGTECFETSANKIRTQGNHPKEKINHVSEIFSQSVQLSALYKIMLQVYYFCSFFLKVSSNFLVKWVFFFLIADFAVEVLGFMSRYRATHIVEIFNIFELFFMYPLVCIVHRCLEILITWVTVHSFPFQNVFLLQLVHKLCPVVPFLPYAVARGHLHILMCKLTKI